MIWCDWLLENLMSELVVAKSFSTFFSEVNFSEWSKYHT